MSILIKQRMLRAGRVIAGLLIAVILILLFQGFLEIKRNTAASEANTAATVANTEATQKLVTDLAKAVEDIKENNKEKFDLIVCMLLVLPENRTDNTEQDCRKKLSQAQTRTTAADSEPERTPEPTEKPKPEKPKPPKEPVLPDAPMT